MSATSSSGKKFDMARDTTLANLPASMVSSGLALDASVKGISAQAGWVASSGLAQQATAAQQLLQLQAGVPPAVPNYTTGEQILQAPGGSPYTLLTMSGNGRVWAAEVSMSIGSSGATGTNHVYGRIVTGGGKTLAIVELCIVGNPAQDSGSAVVTFAGFPIASGATIQLDVNNAAGVTGAVLRASGLVGVSIP